MTNIPDKAKELFQRENNNIGQVSLLAYYKSGNFHTYLYEKDNKPFIFTFDENAPVKSQRVEIPLSLPDKMRELIYFKNENVELTQTVECLKKEKEKLRQKAECLEKENADLKKTQVNHEATE